MTQKLNRNWGEGRQGRQEFAEWRWSKCDCRRERSGAGQPKLEQRNLMTGAFLGFFV